MEIELNNSILLLLFSFAYTLAMLAWAYYAALRERHIRDQLESIKIFHEEQWIINGIMYDKMISLEDDINNIPSLTKRDDEKYIGEYILLKDDEETEPMRNL